MKRASLSQVRALRELLATPQTLRDLGRRLWPRARRESQGRCSKMVVDSLLRRGWARRVEGSELIAPTDDGAIVVREWRPT